MNDLEFKKQVLDHLSSSFCGAKWYNATIWLGSGMTTSCHHPPAHRIPVESLKTNPKLLHNTDEKKKDRDMMQRGERPAGCEYCWKIEDIGRDSISDRVYKSKIYPIEDLKNAFNTDTNQDINLKTLEIAFDRTCQFACSYCNPAFSSRWVQDIRTNGAYTNLVTDGRNHFTHAHDSAQLYKYGETNPYVEAFFQWWDSDLHKSLDELRITGGEPLMSAHTWRLIEWFKTNRGNSNTRLAINSNLGFETSKLNEFIDAVKLIPEIDLYTSCETIGEQAEYIRDGLNYQQWYNNVRTLIKSKAIRRVHIMSTINALCLDSLPWFLDHVLGLKAIYGKNTLSFTLNILRFPSFQSPLVLPNDLREKYKINLEAWIKRINREYLEEHEYNHIQRLIDYLDVVKTPHAEAFEVSKLEKDFKNFYQQYDKRRDKNLLKTFPNLKNWLDKIL